MTRSYESRNIDSARSELIRPTPPPLDSFIVKVASRCNYDCSYCYWFRDASVLNSPRLLTRQAEAGFLSRLNDHITNYRLARASVMLHGGEPLLIGIHRFTSICEELRAITDRNETVLCLSVTTNGSLVDDAWSSVFDEFGVRVNLSLDGPPSIHNARRKTTTGRDTHAQVLSALGALRRAAIEPRILAVCDPESDPEEVCGYFTDQLGITDFDILLPDATHDDDPVAVSGYLIRLFDCWRRRYAGTGVKIRYVESALTALSGLGGTYEAIGYGEVTHCTITTSGGIEPLDVVRIAGTGTTATHLNVTHHALQDLTSDPLWREIWNASTYLPDKCCECKWHDVCGGGHIASRWSIERRWNNPSVYCDDILSFLDHVREAQERVR